MKLVGKITEICRFPPQDTFCSLAPQLFKPHKAEDAAAGELV